MDVALIKVLLLAVDGAGACRGAVTHAGGAAADQATHAHKNNVAHTASLTRLSRIAVRYLYWGVAVIQYRVAAVKTPNSAQLWNNIGLSLPPSPQ